MSAETPVLRRDRGNRREPHRTAPRPPALGGKLLIAVAFAVPFAWYLVKAIADLTALLAFAAAAGHPLNSYAWLVLGAGILTPVVLFAGALFVGWTRGRLRLAAALGVALAATAAISLTLEALLRA